MREIALLGLLVGIEEVSEKFNLDPSRVRTIMLENKHDPFLVKIRDEIIAKSRVADPKEVASEYGLDPQVVDLLMQMSDYETKYGNIEDFKFPDIRDQISDTDLPGFSDLPTDVDIDANDAKIQEN